MIEVSNSGGSLPRSGAPLPPHPWITRSHATASGAIVAEATAELEPLAVFEYAATTPHVLFLDSALTDAPASPDSAHDLPRLGRWSFVAADPIHSLAVHPVADPTAASETSAAVATAFAGLRQLLADLATPTIPGLPPFQGGLAGLISYDAGLAVLGCPIPPAALPCMPLLSLHLYDVVFAYDHDRNRGWFISQGIPARGPDARRRRAGERLASFLEPRPASEPAPRPAPTASGTLPAGDALPTRPAIHTSHPREQYLAMVRHGIDAVLAGDIFQANLAQRLTTAAAIDPVALHRTARRLNPAPFAACFEVERGGPHLVSMSPERFLQVRQGIVRMHPIKGTRRVIASPEADFYAGADLAASDKDRAENVMIVDLVRNDLARVCTTESVRVEALCRLERYRYVQHLVSVVTGRLRPGLSAIDAVVAAIPGGSITGAPKRRACEIISEQEGVARGAYCGCLGYLGLDGSADFNLLIRTFVSGSGLISFSAGGGITAASEPADEHAESLHKAEGMLRVLDALSIGGASR